MSTTLFYCGGDVGLCEHADDCTFNIEENGVRNDWTIAATLERINEFSDATKARILADCAMQVKHGGMPTDLWHLCRMAGVAGQNADQLIDSKEQK